MPFAPGTAPGMPQGMNAGMSMNMAGKGMPMNVQGLPAPGFPGYPGGPTIFGPGPMGGVQVIVHAFHSRPSVFPMWGFQNLTKINIRVPNSEVIEFCIFNLL